MNYKRLLFLVGTLLIVFCVQAQTTYRITGKVTNNKLEPLAFASVQVSQVKAGAITKEDGTYTLTLPEGTYDLMVSMVGFLPQTLRLTLNSDYTQNIILEEKLMEDVVIRVKIKDRSEEIIKNVIRAKDEITKAAGAYSVRMYVKATQQDSVLDKKEKNRSNQQADANADFDRMAMAEVSLKLDYESDNRFKEERLGVKKNGNAHDLFYLTSTDGDFSFYNSLIKVPTISTIPFLSPVSYSGLLAYKFKTLKIEKRNGIRVFVIQVKPRQLSNATVEGEIVIQDSSWAILQTRFRFPEYHLPEYDFFEVSQEYDFVDNKAWLLKKQQFNYFTKTSKQKLSGQTVVKYTDYELNKKFPSKYFGVEMSATAQVAYERDSTFWATVRTEPLSPKEISYIRFQDSIYRVTHTEAYLDSLELANNKINWKKLGLFGQTIYHRKKERTWMIPSLVSLYEPLQFGGGRIRTSFFYFKRYANRKDITLHTEASYGFRNKDINGSIGLQRMYNPFNRGSYSINISRNFHHIYEGDAWINLISQSSYFLNNYFAVSHGLELTNGLFLDAEVNMALRRSVKDYKTNSLLDSIKFLDNKPVAFEPTNAIYSVFTLRYTPRQRYIREPLEKIILGSKWPTFYVQHRKGYPGLIGSNIDFDYLEAGLEQRISLGILGTTRYKFKAATFLRRDSLTILDYSYQRRGDPFLFMNPDEAFQALDSTFAVFKPHYQLHMVHEFNGALINKIPLLKKLQLREIAGGGFLVAPERNLRYVELFAGVERVFKWPFNPLTKFKLGFYVVGSAANQFRNPVQFKVGFTTWNKFRNKWN